MRSRAAFASYADVAAKEEEAAGICIAPPREPR